MTQPAGRSSTFFVLTFAITWGLQVPGLLAWRGILPGDLAFYLPFAALGLLGPLLAATILAQREGGGAAVRQLYAPLLRWRVHPRWYAAALAPSLLLTAILVLLNQAGRQGPVAYLPALGGVAFGLLASIGEEVGWRGYAFPRLERRFGTLAAASWLGVVWYVWHLPMFAVQGVPLGLVLVMLLYFVGASLFIAGVMGGAGGSLVPVVLVHLGAHLNNSHRALPSDVLPLLVHAIVTAALGVFVVRKHYLPAARRAVGLL